ncbi:P-loop containing nucleoside triphosphate hydrolase protein [Cercophora newfieldiana]|uniref:P-loop containing nucleoside triphosphate hydrolase protein n=1 Tax=Cercophora newfieldiana TaxID=92897 RepID=A0AA39YGI9_9PEZI|nr:P-loop containing nucleoside triphosphate hydrolase protein [Cercophora newfieldiana]
MFWSGCRRPSRAAELRRGNNPGTFESGGIACCVIHGLAGMGKTQTALEYTYRYESRYDAIFWIRSETQAELSACYAAVACKLGLQESNSPAAADSDRNIEVARDWLGRTRKRWLLVFDNVEQIDDVLRFIPASHAATHGAIIITAQAPDIQPVASIFQRIELTSPDVADSVRIRFNCLEREARDPEEASEAVEIASIVGGLPLAMATIGGCMCVANTTISEVLKTT